MADLKIPKLNTNSDKYIFKKKLSLRRKSKKRLLIESAFMFISCLCLVYINYLIPNKNLLLQKLPSTINKSLILLSDLLSNLSSIILVISIIISYFLIFLLFIGSIYRIVKIIKRKTRRLNYK